MEGGVLIGVWFYWVNCLQCADWHTDPETAKILKTGGASLYLTCQKIGGAIVMVPSSSNRNGDAMCYRTTSTSSSASPELSKLFNFLMPVGRQRAYLGGF